METQRCGGIFTQFEPIFQVAWVLMVMWCTQNASLANTQTIFVNQVGYLSAESKIAYVSSSIGLPFTVVDAESGVERYQSLLRLTDADCAISGGHVWKADFSPLDQAGEYRIRVPGLGESPPFRIADDLYAPLLRQSLRAFYWLRSGLDLKEENAKIWARNNLSLSEAVVYSPGDATPTVSIRGGWHDGSDLGRYTASGAFAAGILMLIHELFPEKVGDSALNIPESGNGIPDILDEVRWKLEWLLQAQTGEGGFYHKLTPLEPLPLDAESKQTRYLFPPAAASTAGACAALAKASRLYSPYDATFAEECLLAAIKAWRYLELHPEGEPFTNPPEVRTRAYGDFDDSDERFWAALELHLATGELLFLEIANAIADKRLPLISASGYWGNAAPLAAGTMLAQPDPSAISPVIWRELREDLINLAETLRDRANEGGFMVTLQPGEFTWGSNAAILQNAITLLLAHRIDPDAGFEQLALNQLHYILGRNPLSMCYVTGFGSVSPKHPYQYALLSGRANQPFPGLLVGGPNEALNDATLKRLFPPETPSALIYVDDADSFACNEFSIEWNAALAFVAAWFSNSE